MLLDPNELAKVHKFVGLGAFVVSDDQQPAGLHRRLSPASASTPASEGSAHRRRPCPTPPSASLRVEWAADNKTLFLTTEDAVTKRSDKLWRHVLGTAGVRAALRREGRAVRYRRRQDARQEVPVPRDRQQGHHRVSATCARTSRGTSFAVFLPREKKHRYYVDHREGLFYIRTNKGAQELRGHDRAGERSRPEELEGLRPAPRRRAASRTSTCSRTSPCRWRNRRRWTTSASTISRPAQWTAIPFPEPVYAAFPGEHAGVRLEDLSLQLPELHHAAERLRLRHASRQIHAAQAAGSAGRLRSRRSTLASACGPPRATA